MGYAALRFWGSARNGETDPFAARACAAPSYYNAEGEIHKRIARNLPFGGGAPAYFEMLRKWCEDGTMKGMDVTYYAGKESSRL